MLKKFLFTSFINTSLLISTCSAMDLKDTPSLTLSVKKLEKGCEVKNLSGVTNFYYPHDKKQKFDDVYDPNQKSFHFAHSTPGGFFPKSNEEKQELEEEHFPGTDSFNLSIKQIIEEKGIILKNEKQSPEDFIEFGGLRIPKAICQWDPHAQKLTLDFSQLPQITSFLNSQFNVSQNKQISNEEESTTEGSTTEGSTTEGSTTLAIEDKPSNLKIEENTKNELIESNKNSSFQVIDDSPAKEQEVITSLSLTIDQLRDGFKTGSIILGNGTKWTVTNRSSWNTPNFSTSYMTTFMGDYSSSNDEFYFTDWDEVDPVIKWNEEINDYELDYDKPTVVRVLFNLIIKRSY